MNTPTTIHVKVGFSNPYLRCDECKEPVPYWHNPDRCNCDDEVFFNYPCEHKADVTSICPTWTSFGGCQCIDTKNHDK